MITIPALDPNADLASLRTWAEKIAIILDEEFNKQPTNDVKTGTIAYFATDVLPAGYLLCDGEEYKSADYPALYRVVGDLWGAPAEPDGFLVPDLRDFVLVGGDSTTVGDLLDPDLTGGSDLGIKLLVAIKT